MGNVVLLRTSTHTSTHTHTHTHTLTEESFVILVTFSPGAPVGSTVRLPPLCHTHPLHPAAVCTHTHTHTHTTISGLRCICVSATANNTFSDFHLLPSRDNEEINSCVYWRYRITGTQQVWCRHIKATEDIIEELVNLAFLHQFNCSILD